MRDVRFGSLTASANVEPRGGYTPNNGHEGGRLARPLWANSGLMHCNMIFGTLTVCSVFFLIFKRKEKERLAGS